MQYEKNPLKKIITKQYQVMSKKDSSITKTDDIPVWIKHQNLDFRSNTEMLSWVTDDKVNFTLSDKVYEAMVDCLENEINAIIVATIRVEGGSQIDVMIRKDNFQKIFSSYVERLLTAEKYEKLAVIKQQVQKYNLEIT
jgi:hypothetical protein